MNRASGRCSLVLLAAALLLLDSSWKTTVCDAAGLQKLESPQNVQIYIEDPQFTVKWDWHSKSSTDDSNVLFSAYYRPVEGTNTTWQELSGCHNVNVTKCDFSAELDYMETYKVRVKAKRGSATSRWSKIVSFVPSQIAKLGPPSAVHLDSNGGLIDFHISAPGSSLRPIFDPSDFMYELVIWKNDSNEEVTPTNICYSYYIDGLALNTTYCLKVRAILLTYQKQGPFSPVYCIQTTCKVLKPQPKNVRVNALNTDFVVQWDWEYSNDKNVSFTVEYIEEQCLKYNLNEATWTAVLHCEDITTNECHVSSEFDFYGVYFIRIRASNGTGPPVWSNKITFKPNKDSVIGPPLNVMVNLSGSILEITMSPPGVSENQSMTEFYNLSYNVLLWKNSSELKKTNKSGPEPFFTFSDLEPLTLYCLKVQAVTEEGKIGLFSAIQCITTAAGETSFWKMLVAFASAIALVCLVTGLFFLLRYLKQWISYAFFPTCTLPSNIKEYLEDHHMNKTFAGYTEEHKETCCVMEIIAPDESEKTEDSVENKHSTQNSRDSGNYSNEDETVVFIR